MTTKKSSKKTAVGKFSLIGALRAFYGSSYGRFAAMVLTAYMILMSFFLNNIRKEDTLTEFFPSELLFPALMHLCTALGVGLVLFWLPWLKNFVAKLIASIVLALSMIGYNANLDAVSGMIRGFIPALSENDSMALVSIIYFVMLVVLATFIGVRLEKLLTRSKRVHSRDVQLGIFALSAYLFVMPAYAIGKHVPLIMKQSSTQAGEFTRSSTETITEKPDIYYIVLDRYTNSEVLKDQLGYDNSAFTNALRGHGFTVNDNAYSNYPFTNMSIASTTNAQYTNKLVEQFKSDDLQSNALYFNAIWQNSVAKALKAQGYEFHGLGSWYGASYQMPQADRDYTWQHRLTLFGKTFRLNGIEANEFLKSPYYRFAQSMKFGWWPLKYEQKDHTNEVREQLKVLNELAEDENQGGRFIFAHILVPHDPYVFNADGSLSAYQDADNRGLPIKDKYTHQISFINDQMKQLVEKIEANSGGQAVVVLNADEGAFPWSLNTTGLNPSLDLFHDMRDLSDDWLKMKYGILQAVKIPKATEEDLSNLSSVNVFRIILNRYAGYNLEYLPNCQLGLTNGSVSRYLYADITARFTDTPSEQCAQFESLPE